MIYRLTLISDEDEHFMREIQIDADATFHDLHRLILESCGYADNQMTSFFICGRGWEKEQEITLEEMETDGNARVMDETELSEFLEDEKQHLIYTFDPLADRVFFIELSEIIMGRSMSGGSVTRSQGNPPAQTLDIEEPTRSPLSAIRMEQTPSAWAGRTEGRTSGAWAPDMFGDEVDAEEIDLEGLEISDDLF